MNIQHKINKLKNRLKRLRAKIPNVGADKQGAMTARVKEIEEIFKQNKLKI